MANFHQFMSVYLTQCGSTEEDFADGVAIWNNEKDDIREMSVSEVRANLTCA